MADNLELIHAGLPWNNPQKITVKADEYISQLVINRGLLNLLSNDYYLDLKTQRINQYLVDALGPHISDGSIHFTEDEIIDLLQKFLNGQMGSYVEGFGLNNHTAFIIPVNQNIAPYVNATKIQNIINQCPKNLNGNVAIFALTPVLQKTENYFTSITDYVKGKRQNQQNYNEKIFQENYDIDILTNNITFNNFYGGTIIVFGNNYFVCDEDAAKNGKILTTKESRLILEQIQKDSNSITDTNITKQKNINIKGNCGNNNCSVISFFNCTCDAYLWNLKLTIYTNNTNISENSTNNNTNLPSKDTLSLFFPANRNYTRITSSNKYLIAEAINNEEFSNNYISLKSKYNDITLEQGEEVDYVSLNEDQFNFDLTSDSLRRILFGRYLDDNGEQQILNYYTGGSISFWMRSNFYDEDITNVPILYSVDSNENGFYIGLDRVNSIQEGNNDVTQYLETSYASKKKDDLNRKWNFWTINFIPLDIESKQYQIQICYTSDKGECNKILPSKIINMDQNYNPTNYNNIISLPNLNFGGNISLFGNNDYRYNADIKNILVFNEALTEEQMKTFGSLSLIDSYNLEYLVSEKTFTNGMKGALYTYNTTSLNVIGCAFSKK